MARRPRPQPKRAERHAALAAKLGRRSCRWQGRGHFEFCFGDKHERSHLPSGSADAVKFTCNIHTQMAAGTTSNASPPFYGAGSEAWRLPGVEGALRQTRRAVDTPSQIRLCPLRDVAIDLRRRWFCTIGSLEVNAKSQGTPRTIRAGSD